MITHRHGWPGGGITALHILLRSKLLGFTGRPGGMACPAHHSDRLHHEPPTPENAENLSFLTAFGKPFMPRGCDDVHPLCNAHIPHTLKETAFGAHRLERKDALI